MIYVSDPTAFARRMGRRSRLSMGDVFSGSSSSCVNPDGTIDNACVAAQSIKEGQNIVQFQDTTNADLYAQCESNLALNNAQRAGLGMPALPDNCGSQFPANANVTVYTGYGNIQSGSGSPAGSTYSGQGTAQTVAYNPAPAYTAPPPPAPPPPSPPPSPPPPAPPVLNLTHAPAAPAAGFAPPSSSGPSPGGGSPAGGVPTPLLPPAVPFDFSSVPDWAWLAGAAVVALLVFRR